MELFRGPTDQSDTYIQYTAAAAVVVVTEASRT